MELLLACCISCQRNPAVQLNTTDGQQWWEAAVAGSHVPLSLSPTYLVWCPPVH